MTTGSILSSGSTFVGLRPVLGGEALSASAGAISVALIGALLLASVDLGPLSTHMAHHIGLMNILAPTVAVVWMRCGIARAEQSNSVATALWVATGLQLALLWGWHLPAAQSWAMKFIAGQLAMHVSLFLAALLFWRAVLKVSGAASWKPILALLVTGKLACLLGVLLIFSPRLLYQVSADLHAHWGSHHIAAALTLSDQQLAGLLMIAACPLSYLLAGVVIATRMISDIGRLDRANKNQRPQLLVGQ